MNSLSTKSYKYIINVSSLPAISGTSILSLQQSYHVGWNAYVINSTNLIQQALPFLFNNAKLKHVEVNNWTNGWELENLRCVDKNTCQIAILFWPQYLEYIGFISVGGLFVSFGGIVLMRKIKK